MPASVRQARILETCGTAGFVSISELAKDMSVSVMTVRRDLEALEQQGQIERTHGGAVPAGGPQTRFDRIEPSFEQRRRHHADAKAAIAQAAAELVAAGQSIGLDVGTSVLALAEVIAARRDLRVFTNNLRIAMRLADSPVTVYTLGGQVRSPEFSVIGPQAVEALAGHFLDHVFIGVSGLDADGLYDYSPEDTEVKRAFIEHAGNVIVLCDTSKFQRRALSRIAGLERVDVIVTEAAPPPELSARLELAGVRVVIVDDMAGDRA